MYSNRRYTRHTPKLILPTREIPSVKAIEEINPINEIQPINRIISLTDKQRTYEKQNKQTETFLANYNDPTELNSYIDALTNREAVSKKFGETWGTLSTVSGTVAVLSFAASIIAAAIPGGQPVAAALATVGKYAALPAIPAAADVTIEKGIKPIVAGKPKEAGLNLLMNLGETMDYAANPVKGLILEGGEGFVKATGLSNEGRVNYDYDTGFFLTDMLLEIISDPINLVQNVAGIGSNKAITKVVKQSVENINKNFFDTVGTISAEGAERINKQLTKTTKQIAKEWNEAAFKNLTPEARDLLYSSGRDRLQRAWVSAIQKELPEATPSQIQRMLKSANVNAVTGKFNSSVFKQINNLKLDDLSSNVIKSLEGIQHYSSAFDKFMTKGALMTSGYGLGIEAIRKNKGIREWMNNYTIANAKRVGALDSRGELNLKEWQKTKAVWSVGQKYTTMLSGEIAPRTVDTLYNLVTEHFNRNQVAIRNICLSNADPITKAAQLDALFTNLYGCNYTEYVDLLKQIDKLENGKFTEFYKYADSQSKLLSKESFLKPIAGKPVTDTQLFHSNSLESYKKEQFKALDELNKVVKLTPDAIKTEDKFFTIKLNDARQNSYLIHNKEIIAVMDKLSESAEVGAMWNKIKEDIRTLGGDVSAEISAAVRDVLNAPVHFNSLRDLYNALSQIYVPEVISEAFKEKDLAYYIFDQIHGLQNKTVTELLAGFDSVTMPDLMHSLDMFVSDMGVTLSDSVELTTQISISLRNYLEALQNADIDYIAGAVGNEFTQGVETLSKHFSAEFGDELFEFTQANEIIKIQMAAIRDQNIEFLEHIVSTKGTIFDAMGIRNTRELSDLGLALKTVATKENLDLFDFDMADVPGTVFKSAERIGASINRLKKGFEQYNVVFNNTQAKKIKQAYDKFYKTHRLKDVGFPSLQYLRYSNDTVEQFAQLTIFNKLVKDSVVLGEFKDMLHATLNTTTYLNIMTPESLMVTDFAFDAMKQGRWVAEKQIAEEAINVVNRYQNLSTIPRQITQNFINMQNFLSQNKFDRPKMLQYARYVDAVKPVNNMLQFLEQHYNTRFNKTIAKNTIEDLRRIVLLNPKLNKYNELIDTLEAYWRGEKTFQQSAKYLQGTKDYVDEFTPFYNQLKEMQAEVMPKIQEYNEQIKQAYTDNYNRFKQASDEAYANLKQINENITAEYRTEKEKIHSKYYTELLENNKQAKAKLSEQNKKLYQEQYEKVYLPRKKAELKGLKREFLNTRKALYKQTVDKFNEVYNIEEAQARQALAGLQFKNKERQALYDEFKKVKYDVFAPIKKGDDLDIATELQHEINDTPLLLSEHTTELRAMYIDYEQRFGAQDKKQLYEALSESLADASPEDIDKLNLWYLSRPITSEEKVLRRNPETGIKEWVTIRTKTKEEMLREIAQGIALTPVFEELSKLYRSMLGTKYQELFAPISKQLFEEYVSKRQQVTKELYDLLIKNDKKYNELKEIYYKSFKETIDENYLVYHSSYIDERDALYNSAISPKYEAAYQQYIETKQQALEDYVNTKLSIQQETPYIYSSDITPWAPVREQQQLNKLIEKATTLNGQGALKRLFKMNSDQFTKELAFRKRFVVMHDSDITDRYLFNHFKNGLDSKAVVYHYDDTTKLHWFALHKDQRVDVNGRTVMLNGDRLIRNQVDNTFDEFLEVDKYIADPNNPGIAKTLNELSNSLYELTGSHLGDSQGEFFSQEMFNQLYKQMPEEIQEAVSDIMSAKGKTFFDAYAFNESVLGSSVSKRALGMYSSNMITNASNAITQAMNYVKPRTEYVHTVFDSQLSISSPNSIWSKFTDEQLLAALQSTSDYKLMVLTEDKKWGIKVREILPTSVEAIKKAKELGATIVPRQVAVDMIGQVNHRLGSAGLAKLWSRIMYVYKSSYLLRPGAMIRNFIDTNAKTMLETKGEYATYMSQASKILNDVDRLKTYIKEATRLDLPNEKRLTRSKAIQQWFAEGNAKYLNYEQYLELDADFLSQGISGNITRMLEADADGDIWKTYTDVTGWIVEMGNKTEDYNRLAMYLYELDKGATKTSALSKLAKVHFDYSFKSEIEQLIEFVFPFTTFALRNLSYWTETIMKQPWIARNYVHLMKPHWDFKDYTPEELASNYQIQNQIINGQLKLGEFNNKIITFKANPSVQSALTMFADPVNAVLGNLAAPIAVPLNTARGEYTQPLNAIPLIGPMIQNVQTAIKQKTPIPSIMGRINKPRRSGNVNFKNKNLANVNKFTDNTYRTPKYRNNIVYDSYATKGITRYRVNLYPVIDIAHDVRSRYSINVYNKIKNRVKTDIFNGIRYRIRLDANRFR